MVEINTRQIRGVWYSNTTFRGLDIYFDDKEAATHAQAKMAEYLSKHGISIKQMKFTEPKIMTKPPKLKKPPILGYGHCKIDNI